VIHKVDTIPKTSEGFVRNFFRVRGNGVADDIGLTVHRPLMLNWLALYFCLSASSTRARSV
jgi:hypothetical protein